MKPLRTKVIPDPIDGGPTIRNGGCALDRLMAEEQKKPPHLRAKGFLIVCTCAKCLGRRPRL